ncbi:P-loop containing nucleoside triphosphate hydrolase protein, partial [Paraphysoderma sedebokerense]
IIHDIIQLPLQKPWLFQTGILRQSTSGLLLFGPPGTGKTMLARATAAESGANFLNVQMSQVQSMWVGENEKNVRALFRLARKLRPCIIFIDEVDSLLQTRSKSFTPHWALNTINEFMNEWDGILAESNQGIIVMGSTNRPFELDEAVLRRMPRRILVDLPDTKAREEILKINLKDDTLSDDVDLHRIAEQTDLYSGSDIKNLCIAAGLSFISSASL